jgi:hypothetical protein
MGTNGGLATTHRSANVRTEMVQQQPHPHHLVRKTEMVQQQPHPHHLVRKMKMVQ